MSSAAAAAAARRAQVLRGTKKRTRILPSLGIASGNATPNTSSNASSIKTEAEESSLDIDGSKLIPEYSTPDDQCPICKTTRYLNAQLRLLVSVKCYHKMCESCIDRIFIIGPEPCPTCGITLRKTNFVPQMFEDLGVEKELKIRRRILSIFNKQEEDFKDLNSYNDYLTEVEDMIFNLVQGIDVEETESKIHKYQQMNADLIDANKLRLQDEAERARRKEQVEIEKRKQMMAQFESFDAEQEKSKLDDERMLIDEIESARNGDASDLLKNARSRRENREKEELRFLAGLKNPFEEGGNGEATGDDASKKLLEWTLDLDSWDDYSYGFSVPPRQYSEHNRDNDPLGAFVIQNPSALIGGFKPESVWERAMRSAVMGLWEDVPTDVT